MRAAALNAMLHAQMGRRGTNMLRPHRIGIGRAPARGRGTRVRVHCVPVRLRELERLIVKLDATRAELRAHDNRRHVVDLPNPLSVRRTN